MIRKLFASACALVAVSGFAISGDVTSGPQVGTELPGPFMPLNVTGDSAGEKHCLYCENGDKPVVMIFARNADCPATQKLIKQVDDKVSKNSDCNLRSFVVFCTDDSNAEAKLKEMAKEKGIQKVVLSTDSPTGPSKYKVAKDADVTVVLYTNRTVKANHSYKAGELKDADITAILADIKKIAPEAK